MTLPEPCRRTASGWGRLNSVSRALGAPVVLLILLVGIAACGGSEDDGTGWSGLRFPVDPESIPVPDAWSGRAAMLGWGCADRLQADLNGFAELYEPDDVVGYAVPDYSSEYVNTHDGKRQTYGLSPTPSLSAVHIWFVGGSAAFGFGQRDDHTIASWLARNAEVDGLDLEVHNLSMTGWVFPQEVGAVLQRLESGERPPHLVVFYNGWNDAFASAQVAVARQALPSGAFRLTADDSRSAQERVLNGEAMVAIESVGGVSAVVDFTVDRYRLFMARVERVLERVGAEVAYFFQPDASTGEVQRAAVRDYESVAPIQDLPVFSMSVRRTSRALAELGVVSLLDIFETTREPVFLDPVHHNEEGARIVALEMYRQLRPLLLEFMDDGS